MTPRKIKQFVDAGELTDVQVVDLLDVNIMTVRQEFLASPAKAEGPEQAEVSEFAFP